MKFLNINELARVVVFREVIDEATDAFVEFESLTLWEANELLRDVPLETNECCDKCKIIVSLLLVPGDTQGFDTMKHFGTVIIIAEVTLNKGTCGSWYAEDLQIVLIFRDGKDALTLPDVNNSVCDHASIAAGTSGTEWVGMIDEE